MRISSALSVSYTHLDVYKRQERMHSNLLRRIYQKLSMLLVLFWRTKMFFLIKVCFNLKYNQSEQVSIQRGSCFFQTFSMVSIQAFYHLHAYPYCFLFFHILPIVSNWRIYRLFPLLCFKLWPNYIILLLWDNYGLYYFRELNY